MEYRAPASGIAEAYLAAQSFNDLLDDAETETGSAPLPGVGGVGLGEFLENMRFEFIGNAPSRGRGR